MEQKALRGDVELDFLVTSGVVEKEQPDDVELDGQVTGGAVESKKQHSDVVQDEVTKKCVRCCRVHGVKVPCLCNRPCPRCGLIHCEYTISAWIYGLDYFDCNLLIPDLNEHKMDGKTIFLFEHVIKFLDDLAKSKHEGAEVDDSDDVMFVADSMAGDTEVPDSQEENEQE